MMALTVVERARRYLGKVESPRRSRADGQDSHAVVFTAAQALVNGFELPAGDARALLEEFCARSDEPWSPQELDHKMGQAEGVASLKPRGWLLQGVRGEVGEAARGAMPPARRVVEKAAYDAAALKGFAGDLAGVVDGVWLANRSSVDPAVVSADDFLGALFSRERERVVVFTNQMSQGEALWPVDGLPACGPDGVWFLCQPVDGQRHLNPRTGKLSRRSEEGVMAWRYMVLESDEAPLRDWLGALARMPLRIAAIYSSGKRSVHALIRVDACSKLAWDGMKREMAPVLVTLGGDPGALSAVRLTRLPQCARGGRMQKLLFLNPNPDLVPLVDGFAVRDVVDFWLSEAEGVGLTDRVRAGLEYYKRCSWMCQEALS